MQRSSGAAEQRAAKRTLSVVINIPGATITITTSIPTHAYAGCASTHHGTSAAASHTPMPAHTRPAPAPAVPASVRPMPHAVAPMHLGRACICVACDGPRMHLGHACIRVACDGLQECTRMLVRAEFKMRSLSVCVAFVLSVSPAEPHTAPALPRCVAAPAASAARSRRVGRVGGACLRGVSKKTDRARGPCGRSCDAEG